MSATELSVDVDVLELPAKSLLQLLAKKQEADRFFRLAHHTIKECAALFRFLEEHDIDLRFDPDGGSVCFYFSGTGDRFGQVWQELRRHGYHPGQRPKKGDTSFHSFWHRENHARLFMGFESTMCKRVQVGTKMVETPIYETHCGDPLPEVRDDSAVFPIAPAPAPELPAPDIPF